MDKVKVGIIGCGNISGIYFKNCKEYPNLHLVACADLDVERAKARAVEYQIPNAYTVDELLADPEIEIVINLTIPKAHAEIMMKALEAGKHVYVEKPLTVTREEGIAVLELARSKGLRVASAPETFLGGGIQTSLKLIEDGIIGTPVAATAFMMCGGHESWHPDPDFYYQKGGGPMFDMGPYYLTALVTLLGPISRVTGSARITHPTRTITSDPKNGQEITVNTPTHISGVIDFFSGAIGTIITSFDTPAGAGLPNIEIYGTKGTLRVPDPNGFGGTVSVRSIAGEHDWKEIPLTHQHTDNNRGLGVSDLAYAVRSGRAHRANGEMAYHVLEAMHGFHDASEQGIHYVMSSSCEKPVSMPMGSELPS